MADHAIGPDPGGVHGLGMDDRTILYGRPSTDHDRSIVSTKDGPRPDTRLRSDANLADQNRFGVDESLRVDSWSFFTNRIESHGDHSNRTAVSPDRNSEDQHRPPALLGTLSLRQRVERSEPPWVR